jgi:type I restriction enzyme M protein
MSAGNFQDLSNFIWSIADLLRGPYRPPQYERVMLPMTVLRRFDCVLDPTKEEVLKRYRKIKGGRNKNIDPVLNAFATDRDGRPLGFHNRSELDFRRLKGDPDNIGRHLTAYIDGFSERVEKIFERFEFDKEIDKLEEANRLYLIVSKFAEIDLHPDRIDPLTMGLIFEDLIRRFNEAANETAGDHFTPREVIRLMVNLLLEPDSDVLTKESVIVKVCDPACGTGGMLSETQNWIREHNESATVVTFGQDYNPRSYAVAASDLLIKGQKDGRIEFGNTLTNDQFQDEHFDYLLANPPFGVDWKAEQKDIMRSGSFRGYAGKLPRVNDGALLFEAASHVDSLKRAAEANPLDKFQLVFRQVLESLFIDRMELNEELFARFMNEGEFNDVVTRWLGQQVYGRFPRSAVEALGNERRKMAE